MNRIKAMKRVLMLVAAMSSLAFAGVVAVAVAHTVKHPTTVTIHVKKGSAHKPGSFVQMCTWWLFLGLASSPSGSPTSRSATA